MCMADRGPWVETKAEPYEGHADVRWGFLEMCPREMCARGMCQRAWGACSASEQAGKVLPEGNKDVREPVSSSLEWLIKSGSELGQARAPPHIPDLTVLEKL